MRDLYSELRTIGLSKDNCQTVLDWVNTLTEDDLMSNGNLNIIPPAGDRYEDYVQIQIDPIEEYLAKHWGSFSKIQLTSNIKQKFGLPSSEAHQKVCEYSKEFFKQ